MTDILIFKKNKNDYILHDSTLSNSNNTLITIEL